MSAQVTAVPQSLRGRVGSSTAEAASQHSSLRNTLASLGLPASITIHQLCDVLSELDHENLRHATSQDSTSDADTVAKLAVFLSGPLTQCGYPGTSVFLEIQLRALVSSLALLQRKDVSSLDPMVYDQLRLTNISATWSKVAFQLQGSSTLVDKIRGAPNTYLVQLASQYASLIKRGDSPWPSVFRPLADIFFSVLPLAGGQYDHIRDIVGGLVELGNIRQKPRTRYLALCVVQEYTRSAVRLCRESASEDESSELREAVAAVVASLLDELDEILATENFPAKLAKRWHKALAFFSQGPPSLDQGYCYYGLLDCVSQLAAVSLPQMMRQGLVKRVEGLIFDSIVPEFRWKAIEILLSCKCSRTKQYQKMAKDVSTRVSVEIKATVLKEMGLIKERLNSDEENGLRFVVSRPLERVSGSGTPIRPPEPGGPLTEEIDLLRPENNLPRSLINTCRKYSLRSINKFSSSYTSAGLFSDCRHAFFANDGEVSVYKLENLPGRRPVSPTFHRVFTQSYKHGERIMYTASSRSGIVIATNRSLSVFDVDAGASIGITSHEDWDPSGLACHETETRLVAFSGQRQRNQSNKYNGQIRVCIYSKEGQTERPPVCLRVPANDYPKSLSYHADSRMLTCITRLQNKLLVWKLDDDFSESSSLLKPFEFLKNNSTVESVETGMTSATVYQSPSDRSYILCTTAPSSERWHHKGEWSFILPVTETSSSFAWHPGNRVHDFAQFKYHRPLFSGCASTKHHIFAVLDNSGKVSLLRLNKHNDGGIHSPGEAEILEQSLCKQDRPLAGCLRFDPSGSYLFAVDSKGTIIVTEFRKA